MLYTYTTDWKQQLKRLLKSPDSIGYISFFPGIKSSDAAYARPNWGFVNQWTPIKKETNILGFFLSSLFVGVDTKRQEEAFSESDLTIQRLWRAYSEESTPHMSDTFFHILPWPEKINERNITTESPKF